MRRQKTRSTKIRYSGFKIVRGGSHADQDPFIHTTTNRVAYDPDQGFDYTVGFRCASD